MLSRKFFKMDLILETSKNYSRLYPHQKKEWIPLSKLLRKLVLFRLGPKICSKVHLLVIIQVLSVKMAKNKKYLLKIMTFQKRQNPIISIELKTEFQFLFISFFFLILTLHYFKKINENNKKITKNVEIFWKNTGLKKKLRYNVFYSRFFFA